MPQVLTPRRRLLQRHLDVLFKRQAKPLLLVAELEQSLPPDPLPLVLGECGVFVAVVNRSRGTRGGETQLILEPVEAPLDPRLAVSQLAAHASMETQRGAQLGLPLLCERRERL